MSEIGIKHVCLALLFVTLAASIAFADANATNSSNSTVAAATPSPTPSPDSKALDKVKYFLNSGETGNVSKQTIDGGQYYIATINGVPAVLLDSKLGAVTADAVVAKAADAYVKSAEKPFKQSDVDTLRTKLEDLNTSFQNCRWDAKPGAWYNFTNGIGGNCFMIGASVPSNLQQCWIIYGFDLTQYTSFGKSIRPFDHDMKNGSNEMRDDFPNLTAAIDAIAAAAGTGDNTLLASKLSDASAIGTSFKASADKFTSAHNTMRAIVPWGTYGGLDKCAIDYDAMGSLQASFDTAKNFPNAVAIAAGIKAATNARLMDAVRRESNDTTSNFIARYEVAYKKLDGQYRDAAGSPTIFAARNYDELVNMSKAVQLANTSDAAAGALADFNAKYESSNKLLLDTNISLAYLLNARDAGQNASDEIAKATTEFGTNDERIAAMMAEYVALNKSLELKSADLAAGRAVANADLTSIATNSTVIAARAATLPRRENQIDPILVGGIIVVVILGAAAFIFLRRFKITLQRAKNMQEIPIEKMNKDK